MIQIIEVPPFQDPGSVIRINVTIAKVPGRAHQHTGHSFPQRPPSPFSTATKRSAF
jgi:hypothetical protein